MRALASIVTGRRGKWLVLLGWVIVFAALMPLGSKLSDETKDDTASYLPESAESTEVVHILDREFSAGETTIGLIVYQRRRRPHRGRQAHDRRRRCRDRGGRQRGSADPAARRPVHARRPARPGIPQRQTSPTRCSRCPPTSTSPRTGARRSARSPASGSTGCGSSSPATSASPPTPRRSSATSTPSCSRRRCCSS